MIKLIMKDYSFLFGITLLAFSITYGGSTDELNSNDLIGIITLIIIVSAIEISSINLILSKFKLVRKLVLALSSFVNIFAVNLGFVNAFIALPFYKELGVMILIIILLFMIFQIIDESKKMRNIMTAAMLIFSIPYIGINYLNSEGKLLAMDNFGFIQGPVVDISDMRSFPEYEKNIQYEIKLKHKPDIIFISFDALVPESIYKRFTKRPRQTKMHQVLEKNFKPYRNHFTDALTTLQSTSSFMALTPKVFYSLPFDRSVSRDYAPRFRMYNGQTPSPLFEIFRSNGYEVSTFYVNRFAHGKFKGDYIDNFFTPEPGYTDSNVCTLIGHRTKHIGFFGYCDIKYYRDQLYMDMLKAEDTIWKTNIGEFDMHHPTMYGILQPYRIIKNLKKKENPQFLYGHVMYPDDVHGNYTPNFRNKSDDSFRRSVLQYEKKGEWVGALLLKIMDHLKDRKKDTIIYIFGDHGMGLAGHIKWKQETFVDEKFSWTKNGNFVLGNEKKDNMIPTEQTWKNFNETMLDKSLQYTRNAEPFRMLDRYAVYGGLWSDHKCAAKSLEKSRDYITIQLVIHDLLVCLSDNVITSNNKEYIQDFKREKTLRSQEWAYDDSIKTYKDFSDVPQKYYKNFLYESSK